MSAGTSASFCLIFCFLVCSSEAQKIITAEVGQEVILPCKVPDKYNIQNNNIAVEWSRPGLDPDHVFVYRDGHLDPVNQHPSYQNRVDLQDKEMKDGDVSLILKDVMKNDTGRYECRVFEEGKKYPISIINLEVLPPGKLDESSGGGGDKIGDIVGSVVVVILLVVSVGFLIYRRHLGQNPNLPVPPNEAAAVQMSTFLSSSSSTEVMKQRHEGSSEQHQNKPQLVWMKMELQIQPAVIRTD